jgi:type II secretory pathway component PulJ
MGPGYEEAMSALTKQDSQASEERIVKLIADITAGSDERFAEVIARSDERVAASNERFAAMDQRFATMQRDFRRAFRLAVLEARRTRRKHREIDENITRLSAAQLVTEEKFQGLLDALRRGENGHQ